ncbi:MAG: hypothetical protein U0704_08290 [Candidatus Eisenbacteria bacterium]
MAERPTNQPEASALPHVVRAAAAPAVAAALAAFALLSIADTFRHHLTPDTTVYLLHARTWLAEGNRFVSSFDSKGPLLALALAPAVRLLGATAAAAAAAQAVAYAAAALALFALVRRFAGRAEALLFASLGLVLGCSPFLWGAVARPENFAFGAVALALAAGARRGAAWRLAGGALAGALLFTKLTLALAPLAITLAAAWRDAVDDAADGRADRGAAARPAWAALAGFALACGAVFAWLATADSIAGWYRQCVAWPRETRAVGGEQLGGVSGVLGLLRDCGLDYLLLVSLAGIVRGWRAGHTRLAALAAAGVGAELLRMTGEGAVWHYLPTATLAPLLLGAALLGASDVRDGHARRYALVGWCVPLLALAPWLLPQARAELRAFQLRTLAHAQSPDEFLVARLRASYRAGETVLVQGNGYAPLLLLGAPRPAPVLPLDYARVSPAEQAATRAFYARRAPDWVVRMAPAVPMPPGEYRGSTDWAYFVQTAAPAPDPAGAAPQPGDALAPMLPPSSRYTRAFDTGWAEVWRLERTAR